MWTIIAAALALALAGPAAAAEPKTAVFAGGCFWCVEADFDKVPGVLETVSGYTGGTVPEPTYRQVGSGGTGHYEAVEITYDPDEVTYEELLHTFWRTVDPTDPGGQFCDRGDSYLTAIFVADEAERAAAEASKAEAGEALGQEIVTPILDRAEFWPAEDYHQDYYLKNPQRYAYYRWGCGRDARVEELWGDEAFAGMVKKD
ncbi:MAG TPA: peptide-methionine (S)-S-oxide reductase MsrA [Paracoccaceae bacterium]|nr:peptide-methionine (S)-S-oxide reductase MsrA [Paracoccaceae bacterium]